MKHSANGTDTILTASLTESDATSLDIHQPIAMAAANVRSTTAGPTVRMKIHLNRRLVRVNHRNVVPSM